MKKVKYKAPKSGPMTDDEKAYILSLVATLSPKEIADSTGRNLKTIEKFITENYIPPDRKSLPKEEQLKAEKMVVRHELVNSETWKVLKEEFSKEELKLFEETYIKLMTQFKNDVLASEEMQIFHTVKYEILMSRNLKARNKALQDIERLEQMQRGFLMRFQGAEDQMSEEDRKFALNLEAQLNIARSAEQSRTTEYTKLQERSADLMKSLKSTRDQRIKSIESSNKDWLGVIKALSQRDIQEREGRQMELMKKSAEKEYERLGQLHTFEDGVVDRVILSADTIHLGETEEEDSSESKGL